MGLYALVVAEASACGSRRGGRRASYRYATRNKKDRAGRTQTLIRGRHLLPSTAPAEAGETETKQVAVLREALPYFPCRPDVPSKWQQAQCNKQGRGRCW